MYDHNNQHFSISQTSKQNNTQSYNILDVCIITIHHCNHSDCNTWEDHTRHIFLLLLVVSLLTNGLGLESNKKHTNTYVQYIVALHDRCKFFNFGLELFHPQENISDECMSRMPILAIKPHCPIWSECVFLRINCSNIDKC